MGVRNTLIFMTLPDSVSYEFGERLWLLSLLHNVIQQSLN